VHSNNLDSLHQHLSPEILPKNLGGILEDEEAFDKDVEPRILDMEDYYEKFARLFISILFFERHLLIFFLFKITESYECEVSGALIF
jgi:hypothetical protein